MITQDYKSCAHVKVADCRAFLRDTFLPLSVQLIVTDPAYAAMEKHRARGTTTRLKESDGSSNEWFPIFPDTGYDELFQECYRVLQVGCHMYVMCNTDFDQQVVIWMAALRTGFMHWKNIVWEKEGKVGMGYHYRSKHEVVMFFEKRVGGSGRQLHDRGMGDILRFPRITNGYPTEKPVELFETLITQSSDPGGLVVDPFMGSGASGVAALRQGRLYAGCDVSEKAVALAAERIRAVP